MTRVNSLGYSDLAFLAGFAFPGKQGRGTHSFAHRLFSILTWGELFCCHQATADVSTLKAHVASFTPAVSHKVSLNGLTLKQRKRKQLESLWAALWQETHLFRPPAFFQSLLRVNFQSANCRGGKDINIHTGHCFPIFFFYFIYFNWRLITLQHCSGFCHTLT